MFTAGAPTAAAQTFCGWQANHPGSTGTAGFTILGGVEAMPLSLVVRTTVGTPAALGAAVDEAIAAVNVAAGVHWRRGPAVAPPTQLSTAERHLRPPVGELWVVGDPHRFPGLPPGTYASSVIERAPSGVQMPVSTLVVIGDAAGHTSGAVSNRRNAILHEFGHAAGLDHHFVPWQGECQLMSYGGGGEFGAGDIAGLRFLAGRARAAERAGDPIGNLDLVRTSPAGIRIAGWALDPDTTGPVGVHVYVDGRFHGAASTTLERFDVWRAHPAWGTTRGFDATVAPPPHGAAATVCAYAINTGPGTTNPLLGCAPTAPRNPIGSLDVVRATPEGIRIAGWALDPDTVDPIDIHLYVDGRFQRRAVTTRPRPDVWRAHPAWGPTRGYDVTVAPPPHGGAATVCAYAINTGPGTTNPLLGCAPTAPRNPIGSLDVVRATPEGIRIAGWALDPDTADPIDIHLYVDGRFQRRAVTTRPRPDVWRAHPAWGVTRGYEIDIAGAGPAGRVGAQRPVEVCAFAINAGPGTTNPLLGCGTAPR